MKTHEILEERGKTHGDFSYNAEISQGLKRLVKGTENYDRLPDVMKESLDMILHKIARALAGDPFHEDHWDDIAGYAILVKKGIPELNYACFKKISDVDLSKLNTGDVFYQKQVD